MYSDKLESNAGHPRSVVHWPQLMLDSNFLMAQNQFDSIDLSDNNVIILEGFPKLPRLKTLILNNNRITRISRHLEGDC